MLIFKGKINGTIVKEFEKHSLVKTNKYLPIDNKSDGAMQISWKKDNTV